MVPTGRVLIANTPSQIADILNKEHVIAFLQSTWIASHSVFIAQCRA